MLNSFSYFGSLMQLALSRKREFLADSTAVEFTRNPDGLISALQKLKVILINWKQLIAQLQICISSILFRKILKKENENLAVYGLLIQVQKIELKH